MKRQWQISAVFGTVFVAAWTITDTLAQYSCPPDNLCSQKSTYCPDTCPGADGCATGKIYTNNPHYSKAYSGTCKNANEFPVACYYDTFNCTNILHENMACVQNECQGPYPDGTYCGSCSQPPSLPPPTSIATWVCTNCSGG